MQRFLISRCVNIKAKQNLGTRRKTIQNTETSRLPLALHIAFPKFSLRSQKFTKSGQKSRCFRHKSGLLSFVLSARRSLPTRVRAIVTKLLPTPGRLRNLTQPKLLPCLLVELLRSNNFQGSTREKNEHYQPR